MIHVASIITVWNQMDPAYAAHVWNETFNKQLGTKVCSTFSRIRHVLRVTILNLIAGGRLGNGSNRFG